MIEVWMQWAMCKVSNFAHDPLRSYFDECQKNEIHLLYLYYFRNNFRQLKMKHFKIITDLEVLPALFVTKKEQPLCLHKIVSNDMLGIFTENI